MTARISTSGVSDALSLTRGESGRAEQSGLEDTLSLTRGESRRAETGALLDSLYWNIQDAGLPLTWGAVTPIGIHPGVASAEGGGGANLPGNVVRVTFDADMRIDTPLGGLGNAENYDLRPMGGGDRIPVRRVRVISKRTMELDVAEFPAYSARWYTITVTNVESQNGDEIDPSKNSTDFEARGTDAPGGTTLHIFSGMYTGLHSTSATDPEVDVSPPELTNLSPAEGSNFHPAAGNVLLTVSDAESSMDFPSVRIDINRGAGWEAVWASGASQPGFSVTRTEHSQSSATYEINPVVDFHSGIEVKVRVRAQDAAPLPNALDRTYAFAIFDPTAYFSAAQTADLTLTLNFSNAMQTSGAPGTALADPGSYELEGLSGALPVGPVAPSAVNVISATLVELQIPYTTNGGAFRLTATGALETAAGASVTGAYAEFIANTSAPRVTSVHATAAGKLRVRFDRDLADNADLRDASRYILTNGLRVESVARVSGTEVELTLRSETVPGVEYLLTVLA